MHRFTKITKPELGFTVAVPPGWAEFPPQLTNSPYEVARFARRDHASHLCLVFRSPGSAGLDPRIPAEAARAVLSASGYANFALDDAQLGAHAAARLSFDKPIATGVWVVRMYFASASDRVFCLGLGSGDPDAALYDSMSAEFEIAA